MVGEIASPFCRGVVPWMTKVDSTGNLVWEHIYTQTLGSCALSEYFASSVLTSDGGVLANGWTEDYGAGLGLLYVVKTDSDGLCSSGCSDIYPVTEPTAVDISLQPLSPPLLVKNGAVPGIPSPNQTQATTVVVAQDCD